RAAPCTGDADEPSPRVPDTLDAASALAAWDAPESFAAPSLGSASCRARALPSLQVWLPSSPRSSCVLTQKKRGKRRSPTIAGPPYISPACRSASASSVLLRHAPPLSATSRPSR